MKTGTIHIALVAVTVVLAAALPSCRERTQSPQATEEKDSIPPLGFFTDSFEVAGGKIRQGETFTGLFTSLGTPLQQANLLAQGCDSVFDVRRLRAGNAYEAYFDRDTAGERKLRFLVYHADRIRSVIFQPDSLRAWVYAKEVEKVLKRADVTISSSLWNDMSAAGAPPVLIVNLADIFAWTVDFFGLQEGDEFTMLYSQLLCEGELIGIDTVYYAEYKGAGHAVTAIHFDPGIEEKGNVYWNEKGESLRKAFLKAPLNYSRISSGFSYHRMHPVHHVVRAHTAVDYAAPSGTPVMSIGDGTVLSAGWSGGGGGNTVKIKHNSSYTTAYLHLSRFEKGIKAGKRVRQGEVIGYVGMTGTATGPHLDFRVWKDGTPVDPLKLESPSDEPLDTAFLPALDSVRRRYAAQMDSLLRRR